MWSGHSCPLLATVGDATVIDQLEKDRAIRPDLFHFFGAIRAEKLDDWLRERTLTIPHDLKKFWCETGGGDLFESETILGRSGLWIQEMTLIRLIRANGKTVCPSIGWFFTRASS
jgi:hypothetical protein